MICSVCRYRDERATICNHDCTRELIEKFRLFKVATHKFTSERSDLLCKSGHPLGLSYCEAYICCKFCRTNISDGHEYFTCGVESCSLNLCQQCALSKPVTCNKKHPLTRNNKNKITDYNGGYYGLDGEYGCNNCDRATHIGRVTCTSGSCDFDLCSECALCPNGHILRMKVQQGQCSKCKVKGEVPFCCVVCDFYKCRNCLTAVNVWIQLHQPKKSLIYAKN